MTLSKNPVGQKGDKTSVAFERWRELWDSWNAEIATILLDS